MKKIIYIMSAILTATGLAACGAAKTESARTENAEGAKTTLEETPEMHMTGAYTRQRALTDEDRALFDSTYKGSLHLVPQSVSTQVVAGTNYRFVCLADDGRHFEAVIFVPLPCYTDTQKTELTSLTEVK